jgi:general secretion pathway protein D
MPTGSTARRIIRKTRIFLLVAPLLIVASVSSAQNAAITPNYKNADIGQVIEAVSALTGKNFIVDPRVKAQVTMISSTPLSADAFYEAFLSILQVYGFVAVQSGDIIKIMPDANARQMPAVDLPGKLPSAGDEIVTQVVQVQNVNAAQLVPILRPLIPQYGHLAAHPDSNMLIISDRSANVARMASIIRRIDGAGGDADVDIIPLQHAAAAEVVRIIGTLYQGNRGGDAQVAGVGLVADERTNSVLVSGDQGTRLRLRALITHLDTPLEEGGDTRVRYLRYANAVDLAARLNEQISGIVAAQPGQQAQTPQQRRDDNIVLWAEEQTNALIVTAPPKTMRRLMAIVDKLDIRREQVAVETILVAMQAQKAANLGVSWAVANPDYGAGFTRYTNSGIDLPALIFTLLGDSPEGAAGAIPGSGVTAGGGSIQSDGTSFAVILNALASDTDTNIISTPSIVTLDNEEAEITVAQEVPFRTGEFTSAGGAAGVVNPFTTIQRKDVGLVLKITPQINEGNSIMLKIDQEASDLSRSAQISGASDLITNKRTIKTTVMVEDGGIVILGGLIQDNISEGYERVPIAGDVPIIGELFRSRSTDRTRQNLMIFIHPTIIRNGNDYARATESKYNYIRDAQEKSKLKEIGRIRGYEQLELPEVDFSQIYEEPVNPDLTEAEVEEGEDITSNDGDSGDN